MRRVLLVINPISGKGKAKKAIFDILELFDRAGCEITVLPTRPGHQTAPAVAAAAGRFDLVAACGGDGTLGEVINGVLTGGKRVPIGYIPLGSTNDFAASLDIPGDYMEAARRVVDGVPTPQDVGMLDEETYFCYIACTGAFSETSYTTSQTLKNILGHFAYVLKGITSLASIEKLELRAVLPEQTVEGEFLFCSLSNTASVGGFIKVPENRVVFDDGFFELTLVRVPKDLIALTKLINDLLASNLDNKHIEQFHVRNCKVFCAQGSGWSVDGEDGGLHTCVELQVLQKAIDIIK